MECLSPARSIRRQSCFGAGAARAVGRAIRHSWVLLWLLQSRWSRPKSRALSVPHVDAIRSAGASVRVLPRSGRIPGDSLASVQSVEEVFRRGRHPDHQRPTVAPLGPLAISPPLREKQMFVRRMQEGISCFLVPSAHVASWSCMLVRRRDTGDDPQGGDGSPHVWRRIASGNWTPGPSVTIYAACSRGAGGTHLVPCGRSDRHESRQRPSAAPKRANHTAYHGLRARSIRKRS